MTAIPAPETPASPPWRWVVFGLAVLWCGIMIFTRLGHYALWDDEANTALFGEGVWRTGDTTAVLGHNIVAYSGGKELKNLRNRYMPPLQYYVAAPFVGAGGRGAFWARFPFAVCGLGAMALMLWIVQKKVQPTTGFLMGVLGIVMCVSMILYARQCRYFGTSMLLTIAIASVYLFAPRTLRWMIALGVLLLLLLSSNYLNFAALCAVLVADYLAWGRKLAPIPRNGWIAILAPVLLIGSLIVARWNPLGVDVFSVEKPEPWYAKFQLMYWAIRDLNRNEMLAWVTIGMLLVTIRNRAPWLRRCALATGVFIVATCLASPQRVAWTELSDIRYFCAGIPFMLALTLLTIWHITRMMPVLRLPVTFILCGTNVAHFGTFYARLPLPDHQLRVTPIALACELWNPPSDCYTDTIAWMRQHISPGQSVAVIRPSMAYPLMYHFPQAIYAWQISEPEPQFAELPPIHFRTRVRPDFFISFGKPWVALPGYRQVAFMERYSDDTHRPELWLHAFGPVPTAPESPGIYFFELDRSLAGAP
jgi:hypothetical protein